MYIIKTQFSAGKSINFKIEVSGGFLVDEKNI
jgi:hypothetical protein